MVEEAASSGDVAASPAVGEMKTGDYMIHVYIMSGKNFKSEGNDTISPLITVETCGEKKYTASKEGIACGSTAMSHWKEHLFFEPRNIHASKIEMETITIKVMNKGIFRDEMIGTYEFDMTSVYFKDKHVIQHQWIALFNPEGEDFSEITGHLKISIAVQGPGDEQVQLNDQSGPDNADQVMLMPAQIKKEFKQLKIRFIQAEKLPKMDTFGTIDAYIKGKFNGKKIRTVAVTAKNDLCPIEQEFWLPIQWPLASDRLLLQMYDEDNVVDEIVGSMYFSLKKLIKQGSVPGGKYFWHNLYGAPNGYSGSMCDLMNEQPEMGSSWKGRVLMQIEASDAKHPERKEQVLEETIKTNAIAYGFFQEHEFEVIAEVGMGISLPSNSKSYTVMIKIGDFEIQTESPKESKSGYNRWSERFQKRVMKTVYPTIKQMENIFVYLMDGSTPICFWKGKVSEFTDPNPKYRWIILKNDKSIGKVSEDHEAGMIQLKFSIHDKTNNGSIDFKQHEAWAKPPPRRLGSKKIRCFIFQCRDIPSADTDGSSDSYISVWNPEGETYKTKTIEDSLNPIYFETIEMLYDMADLETAPPIIFNIWDHDEDLLDSSDDFLGRAVIYLRDASTNLEFGDDDARCNEVPKPVWHDIRIGFDESQPSCGQVLCSFVVARDDFDFQTPARYLRLSDYVPTKEYDLEINVLGMRQLESFGLMPIKKPFIKFAIKSLLPPEKAQAVTNVCTDPNACGPNPNINTMLTFNVQLPIEELYCPSLACDAYDYVFMGFSQPLIGTFSIPVGALKTKHEKKRISDIALCDDILAFLRDQMAKDVGELKEEVSRARSKSGMSDAAQQRMQKKLKAQANKMRGAQQKIMAGAALIDAGADAEERKEPRGGYNELVDENGSGGRQNSAIGDEENQLLADDDDFDETLFKDLSENDPLLIERKKLIKAKQSLDAYLEKRASTKGKPSPQEESMKSSLQKKLLQQQVKFKEERKKAEAVKREIQRMEMAENGMPVHQNIILPKYQLNQDLKVYEEIDMPSKSMYKAVGYNDMQRVKVIMQGDDADKRSDLKRKESVIKEELKRGTTNVRKDAAKNVLDAMEEENRITQCTNLHYRKFYEDELENDRTLFPDPDEPFISIPVKRGQSRGLQKSWFSFFSEDKMDESGEVSNEKFVGFFKGRVRVVNEEEEKQYKKEKGERINDIFDTIRQMHQKMFKSDLEFLSIEDIASAEKLEKFNATLQSMAVDKPDLMEFFKDASYDEVIKKQLLSKTQCVIQLYVLEGFDFASRDIGSFSDPYLFIKCGSREFSERDNYQLDEANPKIYKLFEFTGEFPGAPMLEIEAYDYDDLFGDDLIGKTSIDLDDRFFNGDWQAVEEKPIEYRQIYHESTSLSQGVITCWLEIEPSNKQSKQQKVWDIAPEPVKDYEIRLSVMDTKNVPCEDFEGVSDVFVRCYIDDEDKQDTDTHFRCSSGAASFNWRLKFDVKSPRENPLVLVMQAWDFDLFKSNDYICEWTLDLEEVFKNVRLTQQQVVLGKSYYDAFLKKKMPPGTSLKFREDDSFTLTTYKDGKPIELRIDLRIMPKDVAKKREIGSGRENPNMEPYLPPPVGRIEFSLNPFKMLAQLVGPEFLAKIYGILCVLICCTLCVMMLPMLLSNFSSTIMMKMFGIM